MAKTIRFNLQFGKHERPIRNIDEFRENFNIDLVLEAFKSGLLQRWLKAHDQPELLEKIKTLPSDIDNDFENIEQLCKILKPDLTREQIEAVAYPFEFRQREEKRLLDYGHAKSDREKTIDEYHYGYACLLGQMAENAENYQFLKASVVEICDTYKHLFALNIVDLYNFFVFDYPLVVLSLLGEQYARDLLGKRIGFGKIYKDIVVPGSQENSFINRWAKNEYLPHLAKCNTQEEQEKIEDEEVFVLARPGLKSEKREPYSLTPPFEYIPEKHLRLPDHVQWIDQKTTMDYWDQLEPKGKKCLIIDFSDDEASNFINDNSSEDGRLSASDIDENKFPILDGLFYKSKNLYAHLVYMEL